LADICSMGNRFEGDGTPPAILVSVPGPALRGDPNGLLLPLELTRRDTAADLLSAAVLVRGGLGSAQSEPQTVQVSWVTGLPAVATMVLTPGLGVITLVTLKEPSEMVLTICRTNSVPLSVAPTPQRTPAA